MTIDFQETVPATPIDFQPIDFQEKPSNGEIRNKRFEAPDLFPRTVRSLKRVAQNPFFVPIHEQPAVSLMGDVYHDVMTAGRTVLEQPLAAKDMTFGGRFIKNLQDTRSIGETLAQKRAEELVTEGVAPQRAALLAGIQGGGLDAASFLASGGAGLTEDVLRAAPGVIKTAVSSFRKPVPAIEDLVTRAEQAPLDFEQWMGRPEAPISAPDATGQHVMFPPQTEGKMGPQIFGPAGSAQMPRVRPSGWEQMEFDFPPPTDLFPKAQGGQLGPSPFGQVTSPVRYPIGSAGDFAVIHPSAKRPGMFQLTEFSAEGVPLRDRQFRTPEDAQGYLQETASPKVQEQQIPFDFTKQASWAQEPALPAAPALQDLIAGYVSKGMKPEAAEKFAKADLGIQDIIPGAPKPMVGAPQKSVFDSWHQDTQELFDSISQNMPSKEQGVLVQHIFNGDNAIAEGNLEKAVASLEQLRGKVDDQSFEILDGLINKYKGVKDPVIVPPDITEDLAAKVAKADMKAAGLDPDVIVEPKQFNIKQALSDLKDIIEGEGDTLGNQGSLGQARRGSKEAKLLKQAKVEAARKRWKEEHLPAILDLMKTTGMNAAEAVRSKYPHLTEEEVTALAAQVKAGNVFLQTLEPATKQVAIDNKAALKRPVIKDVEVEKALGSTDVQTEMMRIAEEDPKLYAAAGRQAQNMAEQMMRLAKGNPAQAEKYRTEAVNYLWRLSKLRHISGLMLRHAGQKKMSPDFVMMLEEGLQKGQFVGPDAELVADAIRSAKRLKPGIVKSLNNGIQEFGINMMLYNTDTAIRNVLGQSIGTILNPVERAANAVTTAALRAARVPETKLKNVTEAQEVIPSLVAGIKAVPGAVRSGIKMFVHETPKGIAESYAIKAKAVRRALNAGKITREQAKARMAQLQAKKIKLQEDFKLQEDMSSLGFSTDRALSSKNKVLDKLGKLANVGTRALKATDLANSQIIKAMEQTAAHVRRQVQMARSGGRGKIKLTAADRNQIIENTLHYSMRQHLPKSLSNIYKGINSNFVTGLTLPFVRAQVALPRFAGQRSPLALGSISRNLVGTLRGKEQFDTMQLTRAVTGTAMAYGAWAYLKNKGVEFHGAALDPKEQTRRKVSGTPMGIYLKFKDGTMKGVGDIAPVSYVFGALAGIDEMYRNREKGMSISDSQMRAAADAMQNIGSGTIFTSTRDLIKAIEQGFKEAGEGGRSVYPGVNEGERLDRSAWENWWQRKLVSVTTPRLTAEAQRKGWLQTEDKTYRNPRDLGEEYKSVLGFGLQKSVPEQRNVFGESISRPAHQGPLDEVFGLGDTGTQDPAMQLFSRVDWYPEPPAKTQDGLRISQDKRMAMLEQFGPAVHKAALKLANNESFAKLPIRQQRDFLKEIVSDIMGVGGEATKATSLKQVQNMSPEQKRALQYELKDASTDIIAGWGLDPRR